MTIILRCKGEKFGRCVSWSTEQTKEPLFYLNKELEIIDYRDTTAMKWFIEIKFLNDDKIYIENGTRFQPKTLKELNKNE